MDLAIAFQSMFLLLFGLSMVGLGLFTTYFGAGKSRIIGGLLLAIGIVVLAIFYVMAADHWEMDDISDSFLGVVGITLGGGVSFGLVIALMMIIKENEPEIPGLDDWEKELAEEKTEDAKSEDAEDTQSEPSEEGTEPAPEEGSQPEGEEPQPLTEEPAAASEEGPVEDEEPTEPAPPTDDDMSEFLREKEENKIVKEDWEKVGPDGAPEEVPPEGYSPDEEPEDDGTPEDAPEELPEDPEEEPEPPAPAPDIENDPYSEPAATPEEVPEGDEPVEKKEGE